MGAVENYLENCVHMKVSERLMEPENEEIFRRYILKYSTRGGSNIFQLFDTSERQDHFVVANRKRWLESQGKNVAQQEGWQNEWHDMEYQGVPFHRKYKQLFFFYSGGVNFLMQLQFLAPVELFLSS